MQEPDASLLETPNSKAARATYDVAWQSLVASIQDLGSFPEGTAATLANIAEEFGADHAADRLRHEMTLFSEVDYDRVSEITTDRQTEISAAIEKLLEARDQLDSATRELNECRAEAGLPSIFYFGGQPYMLGPDSKGRPLGHDEGEFIVALDYAPQRQPTLTEQMRAVAGVDVAEARAPEPRTRGR